MDADEAEEIEAAICCAEGFILERLVCLDYDLRHQFLDILGIDSQVSMQHLLLRFCCTALLRYDNALLLLCQDTRWLVAKEVCCILSPLPRPVLLCRCGQNSASFMACLPEK